MLDMTNVKTKMDAAAGVIVKEGDNGERLLLMIQRASDDHWPNHWEFPRGKCDKGGSPMGENTLKCCKREIKEETGLDVIPMYKIDEFQYLADNGTRLTTCYNFLCKMKDPNQKVKLSNEHKRYKWIQSVGEVELLALPDQKRTIKKILNRKESISTQPGNDFTKNNMVQEKKKYKNKPKNPELWSRAIAAAKKKFDVYPSAYANAWASKWYRERGGKWESVSETYVKSGLGQWFKQKWVDMSRKDKEGKHPPCGRDDADKGKYPKCRPAASAAKMTKKEKESAVRRKRSAEKKDPQKGKGQTPVMVKTKKESLKQDINNILGERDYNDPDSRPELFKVDRFKDLMKLKKGEKEFNDDRHSIQPTLFGLIKNYGGDYRGRETGVNSVNRGNYGGMKFIKKYLPDDWEDQLEKYSRSQAKVDREDVKMELEKYLKIIREEKEEKENKPLNKPFRMPSGSNKKFGVYVKNDKGNVVKVTFGDPNMEIKRDDPERLKSFRARHNCASPGPRWKARYWSCKMWEKRKSVGDYLKGKK
jgi:8-oxo-dGTP pyrophosphatase MutT (NUDIX family)